MERHLLLLAFMTTATADVLKRRRFAEECPDPAPARSVYSEDGSPELVRLSAPPATPFVTPYWPSKNGDLRRHGPSMHTGPRDISTPDWTFMEANYKGKAMYATPLIDASHNTYMTSNSGCIYKLDHLGSVLWSAQPGGPGSLSTPALWGDSLYVVHSSGQAFSLEMTTGMMKWNNKFAESADTERNAVSLAGGRMLVAGNVRPLRSMIKGLGNERVFALKLSDGSKTWGFSPQANVLNFNPSIHDDSAIFMDRTGSVYRLRVKDGAIAWKTPANGPIAQSTGGVTIGDDVVYSTSNLNQAPRWNAFHGGSGVMRAHNIETGDLKWERSFELEANSAPMVMRRNGRVNVVAGLGNNAGSLRVATGDKWKGQLVSLDYETGAPVWTWTPPEFARRTESAKKAAEECTTDAWSSPSVGKDHTIYIAWQSGVVYALNVEGEEVQVASSYDFRKGVQGEPAIAENMIVVASCDRLSGFKVEK